MRPLPMWDAIVVGGGPAGATTALLLARAGADVLLVDRARFPRDKPCSEYLSPATTGVLERLGGGIVTEVERAAHAKLYGMRVVAPSGTAMLGRFTADHGHPPPRPYSFALPRTAFDTILLGAARRAGAVVQEGTTVEGLLFDGGAVAGVVVRSGCGMRDAYRARVVVGADGLRSIVARRLGLVRSSPPRRIAFSAHVADVAGVDGVGELHVSARGYVGLGPIGGGVTTVALVVPLRSVRRAGTDFRTGFFEELERFPGLAGRFDPRRLVRDVLVTGPFARWARRPIADGGGALLVGDAADFFDPFTGQGIYSAVRGAELAAACLIPLLRPGILSPCPPPMVFTPSPPVAPGVPTSRLPPRVLTPLPPAEGELATSPLSGTGVLTPWPPLPSGEGELTTSPLSGTERGTGGEDYARGRGREEDYRRAPGGEDYTRGRGSEEDCRRGTGGEDYTRGRGSEEDYRRGPGGEDYTRGRGSEEDYRRAPGSQDPIPAAALMPYARARRREFAGKWALERLIGLGVGWPGLTDRVVSRLARRPHLADLLVGATGNFVPARRILTPSVIARLLW